VSSSLYARWEDAMVAQARLHQWSGSHRGLRYLSAFFRTENEAHLPEYRRDPRLLAALQLQMLQEAEPTYISASSLDLIDHARQSFKPEPCRPSDPWTPRGFALFERPVIIHDAPPTEEEPGRSPVGEIPIRAMAWHEASSEDHSMGCFWIAFYVAVDDEIELCEAAGVHTRFYGIEDEVRREMPLSLIHQFQWSWHQTPDDRTLEVAPVDGEDLEETVRRGIEQTAFVQTVWRIGSQFISTPERAPRGLRRDAARRGLTSTEHVNVIRLRRAKPHTETDETGRTITVQHPVRGYWGKRHRRDGTRQVWVDSYIRGDDSLPWKDGSLRAYEFNR
jgi:hypothetical protein